MTSPLLTLLRIHDIQILENILVWCSALLRFLLYLNTKDRFTFASVAILGKIICRFNQAADWSLKTMEQNIKILLLLRKHK